MAVVLAVVMGVVAVYSGARIAVPALRDTGHPGDVEAWHGLMGAVMAVMLLISLPRGPSLAAVGVFAVGGLWCVTRMGRRSSRGSYLRLGVCCIAMLAMLAPSAAAAAGGSADHHARHGNGHAMPGMSAMPETALPTALAVFLIVAMVGVVAAAARGLAASGHAVAFRIGTACEIATAAAMAYMLAVML